MPLRLRYYLNRLHNFSASYNLLSNSEDLFSLNMDHGGLFSAKLILTPLLLCIYLNKYDLGRARNKRKIETNVSFPSNNIVVSIVGWEHLRSGGSSCIFEAFGVFLTLSLCILEVFNVFPGPPLHYLGSMMYRCLIVVTPQCTFHWNFSQILSHSVLKGVGDGEGGFF